MRLVTLIGGSGFIGRHVAQHFARSGWRVRVASRRPHLAGATRVYGAVGQVEPVQANIRDDASIARAVAGADVVINLVGILAEHGKQRFDAVQAQGAKRVAEAAKTAGVARLIHVSALGADAKSASAYAQSKATGEAMIRTVYPEAIILRPSVVFGPEDQFFNRFAMMARFLPIIPIACGKTQLQPIFVDDVAAACLVAAEKPLADMAGKTYELGGPKAYSLMELVKLAVTTAHRRSWVLDQPLFMARMQAWSWDMLARLTFTTNRILTRDQLRLLQKDSVVGAQAHTIAELGITPTSVEAVVPSYLWRFRPRGQFDEMQGTSTKIVE